MNKTDYTVKEEKDGMIVEKYLMEYNELEVQSHKVNANTAKKVFSPKFIPLYPHLLRYYTLTEALLCGFIDFYLSNSSDRFYFTDAQLSQMLSCSEKTITRSIFGKIRFVTKQEISIEQFVPFHIEQNVPRNKNSINNNKKIIHQNKFDAISSLYGITRLQVEEWFEHKKSLDRIIYLCEAIEEISSYGGIEPVRNKDTINTTDILLKSFKIEDIKEYCELNDVFELSEDYQELVRSDYYLPYLMDI